MYRDAIDKIIKDFGIYLYRSGNRYVGCCPIHGGDNPTAFNINSSTGYWWCNTAECHDKCENNINGFVQLLLEAGGINCSAEEYFKNNNIEINYSSRPIHQTERKSVEFDKPLEYLEKYDLGNCAFLLNRGYEKSILKKHGVFTCPDPKKEFYHLCIVPIFDINKTKIIGITARMPYEKCIVCDSYHNPQELCSDMLHTSLNPKWRHFPKGFLKGNYLFNLWNSWRHIKWTRDIIITESPGNAIWLEQANFLNSVALLGSTISSKQKSLIDRLDPKRIFVLPDPDEAGEKMVAQVKEYYPHAQEINTDGEDVEKIESERLQDIIWNKLL